MVFSLARSIPFSRPLRLLVSTLVTSPRRVRLEYGISLCLRLRAASREPTFMGDDGASWPGGWNHSGTTCFSSPGRGSMADCAVSWTRRTWCNRQ